MKFVGYLGEILRISRQFFLDFAAIFFWFSRRNTLDLEVKCFGFLCELSYQRIVAWVTQPKRLKGAKDEVKQARRAVNYLSMQVLTG